MHPTFWHGKRVLITGHTGFKGSWLSLWLQSVGAEVVGYALAPPTDPNMFTLASVADGMTSILGDVLDADRLQQTIAELKPEIVFHMAAQALVRESYKAPVTTYATNVMGTVNLLESVRLAGNVRAVVCINSDKCYENQEWVEGYRENEAMGGYDPYSTSKRYAETVAAAYRKSFFNPNLHAEHGTAIATARTGNVIGGGDWAKERLVPDILRSLVKNETIALRNPQSIRPWQHVLEPLSGYLTLAECLCEDGPSWSEDWNFGPLPSGMKSASWMADQLVWLWGGNISWKQDEAYQPYEDRNLVLDCAKSIHRLKWEPVLDLTTALRWTVQWMKLLQSGDDMHRASEYQIGRFMELAQNAGTTNSLTNWWLRAQDTPQPINHLAEQALMLDLMNDTVMSRRTDGLISFWNLSAEKMYGWSKDEAIGQVSHKLLRTRFPQPLEMIERDMTRHGQWRGKLVHERRDGTQIEVESRWVLLCRDEPSPVKTVIEINIPWA